MLHCERVADIAIDIVSENTAVVRLERSIHNKHVERIQSMWKIVQNELTVQEFVNIVYENCLDELEANYDN